MSSRIFLFFVLIIDVYFQQGYPTIIFIPGNNKKNVQAYSGARTEKGMIAYLKEVRTTTP